MSNEEKYENDGLIVLKSEKGEEIEMREIAGIALEGKFYMILQPVKLLKGMNDDEALVFEVTRLDNGQDSFTIIIDDEIVDKVFLEYNRLLDEQEDQ